MKLTDQRRAGAEAAPSRPSAPTAVPKVPGSGPNPRSVEVFEAGLTAVSQSLPQPKSVLKQAYPNLAGLLGVTLPSGATLEELIIICRDRGLGVPEKDLPQLTLLLRHGLEVHPHLVSDLYDALTRPRPSVVGVRVAEFGLQEDHHHRTGHARTKELRQQGLLRGAPTAEKVLAILAGGGGSILARAEELLEEQRVAIRGTASPSERQWVGLAEALRAREEARKSPASHDEALAARASQEAFLGSRRADLSVLTEKRKRLDASEEGSAIVDRIDASLERTGKTLRSQLLQEAEAIEREARSVQAHAQMTDEVFEAQKLFQQASQLRVQASQAGRMSVAKLSGPELDREIQIARHEVHAIETRLGHLNKVIETYRDMPKRTGLGRFGVMTTVSPLRLGIPGKAAGQVDFQWVLGPIEAETPELAPFLAALNKTPASRDRTRQVALLFKSNFLAAGYTYAMKKGSQAHGESELGPVIPTPSIGEFTEAGKVVEEALLSWLGHSMASENFAHAVSHSVAMPHGGVFVMQGSPMGTRVSFVIPLLFMASVWSNGMAELQVSVPWFGFGGFGAGVGIQHPAIAKAVSPLVDASHRASDFLGSHLAGAWNTGRDLLTRLGLLTVMVPQEVTNPLGEALQRAQLGHVDQVEELIGQAREVAQGLKRSARESSNATIDQVEANALSLAAQVTQSRWLRVDRAKAPELASQFESVLEHIQERLRALDEGAASSLESALSKGAEWAEQNPLRALGFRHQLPDTLPPSIKADLVEMARAGLSGDLRTLQAKLRSAALATLHAKLPDSVTHEIVELEKTALKLAFLASVVNAPTGDEARELEAVVEALSKVDRAAADRAMVVVRKLEEKTA